MASVPRRLLWEVFSPSLDKSLVSGASSFLLPACEDPDGLLCRQYGHLKSEGDASITRGDFTAPTQNSNSDSYPEFFQQLLDVGKKNSNGNVSPRHRFRSPRLFAIALAARD